MDEIWFDFVQFVRFQNHHQTGSWNAFCKYSEWRHLDCLYSVPVQALKIDLYVWFQVNLGSRCVDLSIGYFYVLKHQHVRVSWCHFVIYFAFTISTTWATLFYLSDIWGATIPQPLYGNLDFQRFLRRSNPIT